VPPLIEEFSERGQAPLPDLFYLIIFSLLLTFDTSGSMYLLQNSYRRGYEGTT
jgi:hypothetical protein